MSFFKHEGLEFNYIDKGSGIPFIFQHGLGGDINQPLGILNPPSGMRLITFDFRAHGKTPPGPIEKIRFNTFSDDVLALIKYLGLSKAVIGGISMGAAVSLNFALRNPDIVSGLILVRPAWLDSPMEDEIRNIFILISRLILEYGAKEGKEKFINSDTYNKVLLKSTSTAESFLGYFDYEKANETALKFECMSSDAPLDNIDDLKKINVPTLIIANKLDPVHPFEYGFKLSNKISNSKFQEITPKSINVSKHINDIQKHISEFLIDKIINKRRRGK